MCDWHTDNGKICGQTVAEVQTLMLGLGLGQQQQRPGVPLARPIHDEADLWKTVFCPVLATATLGFLAAEGITPGDLVARFTPMGPGEAMPRLLQHTNLLAPLYLNNNNQQQQQQQQPAEWWWNAGLRLVVRCCDALLTLAVQNNVVQQHVHPHAGVTHWVWCRDLMQQVYAPDEEAMLSWVDQRLYAVAEGDQAGLSQHFLAARIRQIEDQLGDLALLPPTVADQTPRQQTLIQELARLHREAQARAAAAAAAARPPTPPLSLSSSSSPRGGVGHHQRRRQRHRRLSDAGRDQNQNLALGMTIEDNAAGHLRAAGKWVERLVAFNISEGRVSETQRVHAAAYGRFA